MSEECSDYVDCRVMLRRLVEKGHANVVVTKHAISRFLERKPRPFKKLDMKVISDTIHNIIRDGYYKVRSDSLTVWTRNYVLICSIDSRGRIVVKTVISRVSLREEFKRSLRGYYKISWRTISVKPLIR